MARLAALERFDAGTEGETRLGALDAAGLVAAIADEVLTDYLEIVEATERAIDRLDERALRERRGDDVLKEIVALRRRISGIRRALAPQRAVFAAFTRPEMALDADFGAPWPGLTDRLDRTIDAVENLRSLLLGTFDLHMARAAKDANDVMKVLTLVSAVFLPAVVLAGVMGMNFQLAFFETPENFFIVIAAMVGLAVASSRSRSSAAGSEGPRLLVELAQGEPELGPAVRPGRRPDPTTHRPDEAGAHEQADAGAAGGRGRARRPVEQLEQAVRLLGGEARPVVHDPDDDLVIAGGPPRSSPSSRRRRTWPRSTAGCG